MSKEAVFVLGILFLLSPCGYSYEVNVHERMARQAIAQSRIEDHLSKNLNIKQDDKFKANVLSNETPKRWIELGSNWEDTMPRWVNHFYNPRDGSGLHWGAVTLGAESSLQWAEASDDNGWCWRIARQEFYEALTRDNPNHRNSSFAYMFRGLGQIIHLVHDLAVPSHVRNDAHNAPFFGMPYDLYEVYARNQAGSLIYDGYPAVDIHDFNDIDKYWASAGKGLAEYTNKNFISRNTNIDDPAYLNFNTPVSVGELVSMETITVLYFPPIQVEVKYLKGAASDYYVQQVAEIDRLTAFSYFDYETRRYNDERVYSQNNFVYQEYARFLVPRAVGYSAGLLDYFFRGDINFTPSTTDPSRFVIHNDTDEDLYGTFEIYYDNAQDWRYLLWKENTIAVSAHGKTMLIDLPRPSDAKDPNAFVLVFKGKMGNEDGAVAGRVVTFAPLDISSPDRCLYGLADGARDPQQFDSLKAKVAASFSPEQNIQSGTVWAVAKYKRRMDYQADLSNDPPTPGGVDPIFAYSVSAPLSLSAVDIEALSAPKEYVFDFSAHPVPAGITDLYLKVLFRGTDGAGQDVIAMGWKDLGEPMHHVYWNATDRFYLDGRLWTQEQIESDPGLLERAQASGKPYAPFAVETNIAYCPDMDNVSKYQVEYSAMAPGSFGRILTITESGQPEYTVAIHRISTDPAVEQSSIMTSPTVVNQDEDGVFMFFPISSFRNISMHAGTAFLEYYPRLPPDLSTLPWPENPPGTPPVTATVLEP